MSNYPRSAIATFFGLEQVFRFLFPDFLKLSSSSREYFTKNSYVSQLAGIYSFGKMEYVSIFFSASVFDRICIPIEFSIKRQ